LYYAGAERRSNIETAAELKDATAKGIKTVSEQKAAQARYTRNFGNEKSR
jgi:hypothetical protein